MAESSGKIILEWDDYFMSAAYLAAQRSKDPNTQVGACIVNENKAIVGVGYNSMPYLGGTDNDRVDKGGFPWGRTDDRDLQNPNSKYPHVCHAALNAIVNKNTPSLKGCRIYTTLFPCNKCAQLIIQSGINEVVYYSDKHKKEEFTEESKKLFNGSGVFHWQLIPKQPVVKLHHPVS